MANPMGLGGYYQIVVNNTAIDKIYFAAGIFEASEEYRLDTGFRGMVSARPRKMCQLDFDGAFDFPQNTRNMICEGRR